MNNDISVGEEIEEQMEFNMTTNWLVVTYVAKRCLENQSKHCKCG